jgi:ribosomal protein S18 acetylase RimI-like enzyme
MTYVFDPEIQPNALDFRMSQELILMRADAPAAGPELEPIGGHRERMLLARFMASQFFAGHKPDLRERIAEANARASALEFFGFHDEPDRKLVGAATLHDAEGAVGIYNVCVAAANRHRGLGSLIVQRLLGEIGRRRKLAVLQCDASLVRWYRQFGFCESGILRVWSAREI